MIDLNRFKKKEIIALPIISNRSQYRKRKIILLNKLTNGWYKIELNEDPKILNPADEIDIRKVLQRLPQIQGYSFGDEVVPLHFDSANFKYDLTESISVYFMKAPLWSISKIRRWENGKWFFDSLDAKADVSALFEVKKRFDKEQDLIDLKGITPELRYYFIIMQLQRRSLKQIVDLERLKLSKAEREKRLRDFQKTLAGRLEKIITDAGGHLHMFKKRGEDLIVIWSAGEEKFNSVIKANTFGIRELGFCASGEDKLHSMSSAVLLAKEYQKERSIYTTRE